MLYKGYIRVVLVCRGQEIKGKKVKKNVPRMRGDSSYTNSLRHAGVKNKDFLNKKCFQVKKNIHFLNFFVRENRKKLRK